MRWWVRFAAVIAGVPFVVLSFALSGIAAQPKASLVNFAQLRHGWLAGIPRDTRHDSRLVGSVGGHDLAVAPTRNGNFCEAFARSLAACRVRAAGVIGPALIGSSSGMRAVAGDVVAAPGSLFVKFGTRQARRVPVTWVSRPISAGFYWVRWPAGVKTAQLVLRRDGRVVATTHALRFHVPRRP